MGKKKRFDKKKIVRSILTSLFILPIIILKWIGDAIIYFGRISLNLEYITYKKISRIIFSLVPRFRIYFKTYCLRLSRTSSRVRLGSLFSAYLNRLRIKFPKFKIAPAKKKVVFAYKKFPQLKISFPKIQLRVPVFLSSLFSPKTRYFLLGAATVSLIVGAYQINQLVRTLPNPSYLLNRDIPATTKIYDRNGKILYEIYAEENRTPIKLSEVPEIVKQATIAIEDSEFLNHKGFSLKGITRALIHNFTNDSIEGGSTITQQLVRSALLTPEKTFSRKLKEIFLSTWAENIFSKEQILEMYLNQVPYGGTAWGIEAAAQTYFGKSVSQLDLAQSALLAGLPAAPSRYSPFGARPELAKARQKDVLRRMVEVGFIKKEQGEEAKKATLNIRLPTIPIAAPHFVMYVKELLEKQYGPRIVERGGLRVTTALDLNLQEMAQRVVSTQIEKLRNLKVGNGAALIIDPDNGEVLAMVGSADYFDKDKEGNVNLATALRQPGSSIKVANYAAALNHGYTAASLLDDSPISFRLSGLPTYSPVNYDGSFHGKVPLRIALASSYNVPAVRVLASIGVGKMIEQGRLMGIESWQDESRYGLSLTLGGGEVTMLEMGRVYATLATGGITHTATPILKISNWRGEDLPLPITKRSSRAIPPQIAFILSSILSDNSARAPAFGTNSSLVIPGKTVAVKTGTSDNKRDNWTIGYTPDYVVVVWVGNNDNTPMHPYLTSGVTGAAPIWNEVMANLLKEKKDKPFTPPEEIISLPCYGRTEYFIAGTQPKGGCPLLITPTPTPTKG